MNKGIYLAPGSRVKVTGVWGIKVDMLDCPCMGKHGLIRISEFSTSFKFSQISDCFLLFLGIVLYAFIFFVF